MSQRQLAALVDISPSHLSRALRGAQYKGFSGELAARIAAALDLPPEYFPETREAQVIARVKEDGKMRDRIFDRLNRD